MLRVQDIGATDSEELPAILAPLCTEVLTDLALHLVGPSSAKRPAKPASLPGMPSAQAVEMLRQMCAPVRKLQVRAHSICRAYWYRRAPGQRRCF